jgi:hypothetical protein
MRIFCLVLGIIRVLLWWSLSTVLLVCLHLSLQLQSRNFFCTFVTIFIVFLKYTNKRFFLLHSSSRAWIILRLILILFIITILPLRNISLLTFVLRPIDQNVSWGFIFTFCIFILLVSLSLLKQIFRVYNN